MRTRLTDVLADRAPRDARRHGRGLVPPPRRRRERGRRHRHAWAQPRCRPTTWSTRSPRSASSPTSPSASTCSPRSRTPCPARVQDIIDGGATMFVAGLGVPRDVVELCHKSNVLVATMCGKVRHAIASVEAGCDIVIAQGTEAGGHTGQIATLALVPQVRRRGRRPRAGGRGRRHRRRPRPGRRAGPRRRRHLGRHPLHRHARGPHRAAATRRSSSSSTRTAPSSPRRTRARPAGSSRTATPAPSPRPEACPSPSRCRS